MPLMACCLQLSSSMATLETALGAAQDQATRLDLEPLALQLRSAATSLRMSANGSAEAVQPIASRLDNAAGDLLQVGGKASNHICDRRWALLWRTRDRMCVRPRTRLPWKPCMADSDMPALLQLSSQSVSPEGSLCHAGRCCSQSCSN